MITNKTWSILLIIAMVTSLTTTFISLESSSVTGFVTSNVSSTVDLFVTPFISIVLNDSLIDFGQCTIGSDEALTIFDSNGSSSNFNNSLCDGTFPDNLTLENDGNVNVNITLRSNVNGTTFFNSDFAGLAFMARNDSARPGCGGSLQESYLNFTDTSLNYTVCNNLTFGDSSDRIQIFAKVWVNGSASGGGTASLTFEAQNIAS